MDFSSNVFGAPKSSATLSNDTMDHASMVMACRFGWVAGPENGGQRLPQIPQPGPTPPSSSNFSSHSSAKRWAPCRGRLYHQLSCSHRIRTDVVDDCGPNCLDPINVASNTPFYCQECLEKEADKIWYEREAQHNATFPPVGQMSKHQYEQWYDEHRQLESQFVKDRAVYELNLKANTRPSNVCSALEVTQEEIGFTSEMDALSLVMASTTESVADDHSPVLRTNRTSLPSDASEQLHWGLSSLALDRGSCRMEYSTHQTGQAVKAMTSDELWKQPRG